MPVYPAGRVVPLFKGPRVATHGAVPPRVQPVVHKAKRSPDNLLTSPADLTPPTSHWPGIEPRAAAVGDVFRLAEDRPDLFSGVNKRLARSPVALPHGLVVMNSISARSLSE